MKAIVYIDGSCWPNPGPGSWAFIVLVPAHSEVFERSGKGPESTTNNRMELTAAIQALTFLSEPCSVTLITDSEYLQKGASEWMWRWNRRNWKHVKNQDLWRQIWALCAKHNVLWEWTRGHSDNEMNNRCDALAEKARMG